MNAHTAVAWSAHLARPAVTDRCRPAWLAVVVGMTLFSAANAAATDQPPPEFLGAAVRGSVDARMAQRTRVSLERAFKRQGIAVAEAHPTDAAAMHDAVLAARTRMDDGRTLWRRDKDTSALEELDDALAELARGPLFTDIPDVWTTYRDALVLRARILLDAGKSDDAVATVRQLFAVFPSYSPRSADKDTDWPAFIEPLRTEILSAARTSIEVRSTPAGARVLLDGQERGMTPLLVEELLPGTHHVAVLRAKGRYTEHVVVDGDGASVHARFGGRDPTAVRIALESIRQPLTPSAFGEAIRRASSDAFVAVLLPAGKSVVIVAARIVQGEVQTVGGTRLSDNDNDRERAMSALVDHLLSEKQDTWVDLARAEDPASLRRHLFSALRAEVEGADGDETPASPAAIAVGVLSGVVVVGGLAAGIAWYASREARKADGLTFTVSMEGL